MEKYFFLASNKWFMFTIFNKILIKFIQMYSNNIKTLEKLKQQQQISKNIKIESLNKEFNVFNFFKTPS